MVLLKSAARKMTKAERLEHDLDFLDDNDFDTMSPDLDGVEVQDGILTIRINSDTSSGGQEQEHVHQIVVINGAGAGASPPSAAILAGTPTTSNEVSGQQGEPPSSDGPGSLAVESPSNYSTNSEVDVDDNEKDLFQVVPQDSGTTGSTRTPNTNVDEQSTRPALDHEEVVVEQSTPALDHESEAGARSGRRADGIPPPINDPTEVRMADTRQPEQPTRTSATPTRTSIQKITSKASTDLLMVALRPNAERVRVWVAQAKDKAIEVSTSRAQFWDDVAEDVKKHFVETYRAYSAHAYGSDEWCPLSSMGSNETFGGIGMQILDVISAFVLMDLPEELQEAERFVRNLDFTRASTKVEVSVFELMIRAVGGLESAHALTGRKVYLRKAEELVQQIARVFDTPSGLPFSRVRLGSGLPVLDDNPTILSEIGTLQLEMRYLSDATGNATYRDWADSILHQLHFDYLEDFRGVLLQNWRVAHQLKILGIDTSQHSGLQSQGQGVDSTDASSSIVEEQMKLVVVDEKDEEKVVPVLENDYQRSKQDIKSACGSPSTGKNEDEKCIVSVEETTSQDEVTATTRTEPAPASSSSSSLSSAVVTSSCSRTRSSTSTSTSSTTTTTSSTTTTSMTGERPVKDLMPSQFTNPRIFPMRVMMNSRFSLGGQGDSYYEYLLKQYLQDGSDLLAKYIWETMLDGIQEFLVTPRKKYLIERTMTGQNVGQMAHLACFFPGLLRLHERHLGSRGIKIKKAKGSKNKPQTSNDGDHRHVGDGSAEQEHLSALEDLIERTMHHCFDFYSNSPTGLAPEAIFVDDDEDEGDSHSTAANDRVEVEDSSYHSGGSSSSSITPSTSSTTTTVEDHVTSTTKIPSASEDGRETSHPRGPRTLYVPHGLAYSLLRPETVESLYYLDHYLQMKKSNKDHQDQVPSTSSSDLEITTAPGSDENNVASRDRWRQQAYFIWTSLKTHAFLPFHGFCTVPDVSVTQPHVGRSCPMHTFVLSETLLYLYLTFKDPAKVMISNSSIIGENIPFSLDDWVFNTEAHPLPRTNWGGRGRAIFEPRGRGGGRARR
ncbi:unnamed protein product [Amoebophrya sp. A25]|nr:unnamed protein product [Amoebophrya sp. A25]|eukprot:GSA25T00009039001.1